MPVPGPQPARGSGRTDAGSSENPSQSRQQGLRNPRLPGSTSRQTWSQSPAGVLDSLGRQTCSWWGDGTVSRCEWFATRLTPGGAAPPPAAAEKAVQVEGRRAPPPTAQSGARAEPGRALSRAGSPRWSLRPRPHGQALRCGQRERVPVRGRGETAHTVSLSELAGDTEEGRRARHQHCPPPRAHPRGPAVQDGGGRQLGPAPSEAASSREPGCEQTGLPRGKEEVVVEAQETMKPFLKGN